MVEISLSGSGEGSGWVTAPGYSTAAFPVEAQVWARCRPSVLGRTSRTKPGGEQVGVKHRPRLLTDNGPA
jgi:hypothetical protein